MKLLIRVLCLLMAIMLFSACGKHDELTVDDVLATAYEHRLGINRPDLSAAQDLIDGYTPGSVNADMMLCIDSGSVAHLLLSREEAIVDAKLYFEMLRYAYAGYTYFGGDEIFLPIFDEIMEALTEQEEWPHHEFANLIYNQLSGIINDNHLHINGRVYAAEYSFFTWEMPFDKDGDRYYRKDTGLYVKEIAGYDLHEVFRLSMNEQGEFCYLPVFVEPKDESVYLDIRVIYENGDEEMVSIRWRSPPRWPLSDSELRYEGNIPIVTLRQMHNPFQDDEYFDAIRFLSFADDVNFPDQVVANDTFIILLIDRYVSSAGEVFTDLIFNMENTLVIGQNTAGCLITGGVHDYRLPNSNISFSITHGIFLFDEAHFREGIGIAPDVWVAGDALIAALAMLERR